MSVSINAICRKDRINQNRTTNIYLRFTVNRRSRYVSTGINIPADDWDFDTQTLKTQNPAVQLRIYEQIEKYDKRIKRLEALEVPVTTSAARLYSWNRWVKSARHRNTRSRFHSCNNSARPTSVSTKLRSATCVISNCS